LKLEARTENIVLLPTHSSGQGLIFKQELIPGVYLAESLTVERDGHCITSIVNTLSEEVTLDTPLVTLENYEIDNTVSVFSSHAVAEDANRLAKLHNELRLDHLNSEERSSLIQICEDYNEIFHLPGDRLTSTTAAEHTIPTPTIDPTRGINSKPYRIPEIHREEVQRQTEQMLQDGIIEPSTSP